MQVNSVSSRAAEGKQVFGNLNADRDYQLKRAYLEQFANASDKDIQSLAYKTASQRVNDKKHKRITDALYYSVPLAAGLAAAVRSPEIVMKTAANAAKKSSAKMIDLTRYGRMARFLNTSVSWAATFLAVDAIFGTKRYLDKKVPDMGKFTQEHPVISSLATVGVAIGALIGLNKGASKLLSKVVKNVPDKEVEQSIANIAKKLNKNKFLDSMAKKIDKVPSAIKEFTKGVIDFSPMLLIFGSIAHSFNHQSVKTREAIKDYNEIKEAQNLARQAIAVDDAMRESVEL